MSTDNVGVVSSENGTITEQFGRFTLFKGSPPMPPAKCVVCGSTHGEFVDFGFDLDFYGVIYFCSTCYGEGADCFISEKVKSLKNQVAKAREIVGILEKENAELRNALGVIDRTRDRIHNSPVDPNQLTLSFDEDGENQPEGGKEGESGDNGEVQGGQSGSSESSNESGRTDVRDDDDLEKLLSEI